MMDGTFDFLFDSGESNNVDSGAASKDWSDLENIGWNRATENGDEGLRDAERLNSKSFWTPSIVSLSPEKSATQGSKSAIRSVSSAASDHSVWQTGTSSSSELTRRIRSELPSPDQGPSNTQYPSIGATEWNSVSVRSGGSPWSIGANVRASVEKGAAELADGIPALREDSTSWFELPDRVKDEILSRLPLLTPKTTFCPPLLPPKRPSSVLGEFETSSLINRGDSTGDFHLNDVPSTVRAESYLASPGNFAGESLLSSGPDLSKALLVAGSASGCLCIHLGKAKDLEKLLVYNPTTTGQKLIVLPPLVNVHPLVMHMRVDENQLDHYKVLVAGCTTTGNKDPSLIAQEYSSTTGEWKYVACMCPWYGLLGYQNGVYFADSERELLLCVGVLDMKLGTQGILMCNLTKKQWEQGPTIPLAGPSESPNVISYGYSAIQVVECGGSIFIFSERECEQDVYSCVHRLNMVGIKLEEIIRRKGTGMRANSPVYPGYNYEVSIRDYFPSLLSATVLLESGFMFGELEEGKDVFICIHKFKPSPHGSSELLYRCKRKRRRAPNWAVAEIDAFLKLMEAGLAVVDGPVWGHISQGLETYGFDRISKACEDLWGTLLRRHTDTENDLELKNIHRDTSAWVSYWNQGGNGRIKKKVFSLESYERMNRILCVKPRRKARGNKKQIVNAASAPSSSAELNCSSCLSHLQVPNNSLSSTLLDSETLATESLQYPPDHQGDDQQSKGDLTSQLTSLYNFLSGGDQNLTNKQRAEKKEEALKLVKRKMKLDILRLESEAKRKARSSPN